MKFRAKPPGHKGIFMKRMVFILTLVLAVVGVTFSGQTSSIENSRLITTGSSTVAPLIAELARIFEQHRPGTRIDVETGGSSRGIADVRSGVVDFGMASRALKPEEKEEGLRSITVAMDGIAIVLHKKNPVSALTHDQIRDIYLGRINRWATVGGRDAPITVINKAQGRSTLELFLEHFSLRAEEVKASSIIGDNQQGLKLLSSNTDAIGYVSIGAAEYELEQGRPLKLLPMGGIEATTLNVRNGSYPLVRPLNLIVRGALPALAKEFIGFLRSESAANIIEEFYFVPVES